VLRHFDRGVLIAVVDGLGHGEEAAAAAGRAVREIEEHGDEEPIPLVRRCHRVLGGTRGVVMSVASINAADDTMTWLGVGNVAGVLLHADPQASNPVLESLVQRGGVVGHDLPLLRGAIMTLVRGDVMAFATDGIRPDFTAYLNASRSPHEMAEAVLKHCGKATDDALVLVARYRGGGGSSP
jgi:hypothetical protein